jgi:hypothetical protein
MIYHSNKVWMFGGMNANTKLNDFWYYDFDSH